MPSRARRPTAAARRMSSKAHHGKSTDWGNGVGLIDHTCTSCSAKTASMQRPPDGSDQWWWHDPFGCAVFFFVPSGSFTFPAIKVDDDATNTNVALDPRTLGRLTKSEHFVSLARLNENDVIWLPAPFAFMAVGVGETESYMLWQPFLDYDLIKMATSASRRQAWSASVDGVSRALQSKVVNSPWRCGTRGVSSIGFVE